MATVHDLQERLEQIDTQILKSLEDRMKIVTDALNDEEPALADELETLTFWTEEAAEMGLDEALAEKICKLVMLISKKTEED